ncbi:MAG: ATP-binding protein [Firmicutes bacterium]|nr:ATP-binding protein [Bacillota bacterium]
MKKAYILRITLIVSAALLLFIAAMLIAIPQINRRTAKDHALSYLQIFEKYAAVNDDYESLVKLANGDLRISVINLDGTVIADTLTDIPSLLENHLHRREVARALEGGIGEDVRKSDSFGVSYLYMAKKAGADGAEIILRVAIPIKSINAYLWPLIGIMAALFALVLLVLLLLMPKLIRNITQPIAMINEKLQTAGTAQSSKIVLTKYDEINSVLTEIDDISEKLHATLADYQAEKHKLDLIVDNIDQAIIALDEKMQIISCNKTAEDYFCFTFSAPVPAAYVFKNTAILNNINQAVLKNEYICYDHMRQNGQVYEVRFFPVNAPEFSVIITAQNVTDVRKTDIEKQEFFTNAGHELNTPLSSIIGYSEMLLKEKKYNKNFAETIHREASRMKLLITDMLKISELSEHKEIHDEKMDLAAVVQNAVTAMQPKAQAKSLTLTADLEACAILANAEKITEVAVNLIDNAIKYTDAGGTVSVSLQTENGRAHLTVKDTGLGIPQADLRRVFERFYRVDKGRAKKEGGLGLGLAIVKHICNHYNAPIKIHSTEGTGTEITVSWAVAANAQA